MMSLSERFRRPILNAAYFWLEHKVGDGMGEDEYDDAEVLVAVCKCLGGPVPSSIRLVNK